MLNLRNFFRLLSGSHPNRVFLIVGAVVVVAAVVDFVPSCSCLCVSVPVSASGCHRLQHPRTDEGTAVLV